jgi:hypothetical protein
LLDSKYLICFTLSVYRIDATLMEIFMYIVVVAQQSGLAKTTDNLQIGRGVYETILMHMQNMYV